MSHSADEVLLLFLALVGLYSPVAAVSSYMPLLQPFGTKAHLRLAVGLFVNVAVITVVTILVGEPLLELLGLTTAALSATGGISLMIAAVPMMLGKVSSPAEQPALDGVNAAPPSWQSVVFMPLTFPLTIGGATIGILVGFRADVRGTGGVTLLVVAALVYALVTGLCVGIAGKVGRRLSERARVLIDRIAGILLVAIAATLLASGFTRLVIDVLRNVKLL